MAIYLDGQAFCTAEGVAMHGWVGSFSLCLRKEWLYLDGCAVLRNKRGGYTRMNGLLCTVTAQQKGWLHPDERVAVHSYCAAKGVATPG